MIKFILYMLFPFLFFFGCEEPQLFEYEVTVDPRLTQDSNGYYHLTLDRGEWQTIHRFNGTLTVDGEPIESYRVEWTSSHQWVLSDTLGYVVEYGYTDDLQYIEYDTTYIWLGQEEFLVPTVNCCSYTNKDGEFNTVFGPVLTMLGDTVKIALHFGVGTENFQVILD